MKKNTLIALCFTIWITINSISLYLEYILIHDFITSILAGLVTGALAWLVAIYIYDKYS